MLNYLLSTISNCQISSYINSGYWVVKPNNIPNNYYNLDYFMWFSELLESIRKEDIIIRLLGEVPSNLIKEKEDFFNNLPLINKKELIEEIESLSVLGVKYIIVDKNNNILASVF